MTTLAAVILAAKTLTVDRAHSEVRFAATVQPNAMSRPFGVEGHHAIVWKGGMATCWALFVADASDHDVRAALDSLGGKRVEGTPFDVFVEWNGTRFPPQRVARRKRKSCCARAGLPLWRKRRRGQSCASDPRLRARRPRSLLHRLQASERRNDTSPSS